MQSDLAALNGAHALHECSRGMLEWFASLGVYMRVDPPQVICVHLYNTNIHAFLLYTSKEKLNLTSNLLYLLMSPAAEN